MRTGVSVNHLAVVAVAEKIAVLHTADFMQARAGTLSPKDGKSAVSRAQFLAALDGVPEDAEDAVRL